MENRRRAIRRRKYGERRSHRKLRRDPVTQEMMNELIGRRSKGRKLSFGQGQGQGLMGMGMDPQGLADISNVMNGGHMMNSNSSPLNNMSDIDGSLGENVESLGQKGIKELSKKMVDEFMPQVQSDVDREMTKKFGPNYLMGHAHHHRHHHHHHTRPRCKNIRSRINKSSS
jgi:hypothetical protein